MDLLGNTLAAIAFEKAGIIKPGVPVVVGESHPETAHHLRTTLRAHEEQSRPSAFRRQTSLYIRLEI